MAASLGRSTAHREDFLRTLFTRLDTSGDALLAVDELSQALVRGRAPRRWTGGRAIHHARGCPSPPTPSPRLVAGWLAALSTAARACPDLPPLQIGYGVSAEDARAVLAAHDIDRNGSLDFAEFKAFLTANAGSIQARAPPCPAPPAAAAGAQRSARERRRALARCRRHDPCAAQPARVQEAVRRRLPGAELDELEVTESSSLPPQGSMSASVAGSDDPTQDP